MTSTSLLNTRPGFSGSSYLPRRTSESWENEPIGAANPFHRRARSGPILAGSDTTRGALAVQVSLLLQHAEQWDAVRANPALIPGAVSEALRYEPIPASIPRFTLADGGLRRLGPMHVCWPG
jgi:hypothetical protein